MHQTEISVIQKEKHKEEWHLQDFGGGKTARMANILDLVGSDLDGNREQRLEEDSPMLAVTLPPPGNV